LKLHRPITCRLVVCLLCALAALPAMLRGEDDAAVEKRLADSARYLASDELEGRGLGSKGLELAAQYIAGQFQQLGLKTDLCQGTPFQKFRVTTDSQLGSENRLALAGPADATAANRQTFNLTLGSEYTPLAISGSVTFDLPLVFVGYGITARPEGYDDYAGVDVSGKAVVVLRHEPQQADPHSVFAGTQDSDYAYLRRKVSNAYEHGAAAVIFCTDQFYLRDRRQQDDPLLSFYAAGSHASHPGLAVLHCRRAGMERAIRAVYGTDLAGMEERIDRGPTPHSRPLMGWSLSGRTDIRRTHCEAQNVVAVLPGAGPSAEETIVIGAHYDHLGVEELPGNGRAIYHGADDNASGVAVLLEIARSLARRPEKLPRRVVFVAFSAEEEGFLGSSHYVNSPAVPLQHTIAMINLDMVGRLRDDTLTVMGSVSAPGFGALVDRINERHGLRLDKPTSRFGRSDQLAFYAKTVPILDFFTSRHEDYHRPGDTADKLNLPGMRRIGRLAEDVLVALADAPGRPEYVALVTPEAHSYGQEPALGVIADFTRDDDEVGLPLGAVVKGGPADRAGLRAGDVVIQLGRNRIAGIDDFDDALSKYTSGDRVPAVVKRGDKSLTLEVAIGPAQ